MLKNQLLVVQNPFQWEGMIQMDPRILSKSLKIIQKIKTITWKEPLETSENIIGRRKTQENSENRAIDSLNSECRRAIRSSRSIVQI